MRAVNEEKTYKKGFFIFWVLMGGLWAYLLLNPMVEDLPYGTTLLMVGEGFLVTYALVLTLKAIFCKNSIKPKI